MDIQVWFWSRETLVGRLTGCVITKHFIRALTSWPWMAEELTRHDAVWILYGSRNLKARTGRELPRIIARQLSAMRKSAREKLNLVRFANILIWSATCAEVVRGLNYSSIYILKERLSTAGWSCKRSEVSLSLVCNQAHELLSKCITLKQHPSTEPFSQGEEENRRLRVRRACVAA